MRVDYFVLVATALIGWIGSVAAVRQWTVDTGSCTGAKRKFIQGGMNGAFHMVDVTIEGLQNNNEKVQNVTRWLFGTTNIDGLPPQQKLLQIFAGQDGIREWDAYDYTGTQFLDNQDTKIYCDLSRFQKRPSGGYYNTESGFAVSKKMTCNFPDTAWSLYGARRTWSQIQVCPWFLDYAMKKSGNPEYTTQISKSLWSKIGGFAFTVLDPGRPIDLVSLFDATMIHELTHVGAGGVLTTDVKMPGNIPGKKTHAYGWRRCRKLATQRTNADQSVLGPERNADSLSTLATAVYIIEYMGGVVNEDGSFSIPPAAG
ncbi:hypothetical protein V8E54_001883 [Elaphomyces granulatus]